MFSFGAPIMPVKGCKQRGSEYPQKSAKRMNCVSTKKKNLAKLGSSCKSSFPSFWAPIAPTKNSHKEKIAALNECKGMKVRVANKGPRRTQELTLTIVFFSFGAQLTHTKSYRKENTNALK